MVLIFRALFYQICLTVPRRLISYDGNPSAFNLNTVHKAKTIVR